MDQKAEILQLLVPKDIFAENTLLLIHAGLAFKNLWLDSVLHACLAREKNRATICRASTRQTENMDQRKSDAREHFRGTRIVGEKNT